MVTYVANLPDCEKWKRLISNLAKDHLDSRGVKQIRKKSRDIKVVSPAEADIAVAKSKVKQYKKKVSQQVSQKVVRSRGVKTGQQKQKSKTKTKGKKATPPVNKGKSKQKVKKAKQKQKAKPKKKSQR
jgi:hypothetical protein